MKRNIFFGIFFSTLFFWQCSNELDINDNWKDYTVVYGLLNPVNNTQIIRVSKSFLGEGNAYQMAQIPDSIYYQKPILVTIEEWFNGNLTKTIPLYKDSLLPRDSGVFAFTKNYYYVTNEPLRTDAIYKLVINIDGKIVSSETKMIPDFSFVSVPSMISFSTTSNFKFSFSTPKYGRIFQTFIHFYYYDITATDTIRRLMEIPLGKYISNNIEGNEIVNYEYPGIKFYQDVANRIQHSEAVLHRVAAKMAIQLVVYAGSNDMYAYMQVSAPNTSLSMDKPSYSNISNGLGLFTSRYTKYDMPRQLTQRTIDSLAYGQFTKNLKFLNYSNSLIAWQHLP